MIAIFVLAPAVSQKNVGKSSTESAGAHAQRIRVLCRRAGVRRGRRRCSRRRRVQRIFVLLDSLIKRQEQIDSTASVFLWSLTSFSVIESFLLTNFQFDPFGSYTNEELFVSQADICLPGKQSNRLLKDMQLHSRCSRLEWKRRSSSCHSSQTRRL